MLVLQDITSVLTFFLTASIAAPPLSNHAPMPLSLAFGTLFQMASQSTRLSAMLIYKVATGLLSSIIELVA